MIGRRYFVYSDDGKILRVGVAPEPLVRIQARVGEFVAEGSADELAQYVVGGELRPRPQMPLVSPEFALVNDPVVFTGVPSGALIRYPGGSEIMDGSGILEWQTEVAGVFEFAFELFPYLPLEVSIEVADV